MSRPKDAVRRGSVPSQGKDAQAAVRPKDVGRQVNRPWPGIGLAVLGALFMVFGIYRGEMPIVLQKAIRSEERRVGKECRL